LRASLLARRVLRFWSHFLIPRLQLTARL